MSQQHAQAARGDAVLREVREERIAQAMRQNAANQESGRAVRLGGRRRTDGRSVKGRDAGSAGWTKAASGRDWEAD
ncbi:hypothetical protein TRAPUB_8807 [Trametes pubescens]|uniref:Uncharacterized protein n=1 Tax=Trametes pubescens TaxID=154538 RepID=A0A1M2W475_TRAPU|nr:hypothetical protein TRAPUB_8807 [Trametes pubescens]